MHDPASRYERSPSGGFDSCAECQVYVLDRAAHDRWHVEKAAGADPNQGDLFGPGPGGRHDVSVGGYPADVTTNRPASFPSWNATADHPIEDTRAL